MQRSDLLALRERVAARGGFAQLLAAIELMLMHHDPIHEHERHPAVRHYRVAAHIARNRFVAAVHAEPDEAERAGRAFRCAYADLRQAWASLERDHPELAANVLTSPNSYAATGITLDDMPWLAPPFSAAPPPLLASHVAKTNWKSSTYLAV